MADVVIPFSPRPHQRFIYERLKRFNIAVCHRRFGKTLFGLNWLIKRGILCKRRNPRLMYIAPFRTQAKEIAWEWLKYFTSVFPNHDAYESTLQVKIYRGKNDTITIGLYGADNPTRARGPYADAIVLDEAQDINPKIWSEVLLPMIGDPGREPGAALFIGTFAGQNAFYDRYIKYKERAAEAKSEYFAALFKASETQILSPDFLEQCRAEMDPDEYNQEFECEAIAAVVGAYYNALIVELEKQGRLSGCRYDPRLPVHTATDLGLGPSLCSWLFQIAGNEIRVIDGWQGQGSDSIVDLCAWLNTKEYNYGTDFLPHDAGHGEVSDGKTRVETWREMRRERARINILKKFPRDDGINAVKVTLPRCRFDCENPRVAEGVKALRHYRREWVEDAGVFKPMPKHDWASHWADGFRYGMLGFREEKEIPLQTVADSGYSRYSLSRRPQAYAEADYDIYGRDDAEPQKPYRKIVPYHGRD